MNKQTLARIAKTKKMFSLLAPKDVDRQRTRATRDMAPYGNLLRETVLYCNLLTELTVVEIGVRRGVSTKAMLAGLYEREEVGFGTGHLYSFDKDLRNIRVMGGTEEMRRNWTFCLAYSNKPSWERSKREDKAPCAEWDGKPIDILWIDGDHSLQGIRDDWEYWEPFVKPGGLILLHDVQHRLFGVKDFWEEIPYPKSILPLNASGVGIVNKPL